MKNQRLNEFQVGLLTVAAITILIVGMMWFKNMDLTKGSIIYQVDFERVEGLQPGDRVQVRGIRMGEVLEMAIMQESVRVSIQLEDQVDLREDAIITLGEKGIVGEIVLEVDPGIGATVAEGHIYQGRTAGTIAAMTDAAGAALEEMRALTAMVTTLVEEVQQEGKVVETLSQANKTLDKVDSMIEENHREVAVILDNLVVTSDSLRAVLESGKIDQALSDASGAMVKADSLMTDLSSSATRLDVLLHNLTEGEGSAAKLLNDPMLYDRADSTLASVKRLVDAMRRNPKRYFKVNVVDF